MSSMNLKMKQNLKSGRKMGSTIVGVRVKSNSWKVHLLSTFVATMNVLFLVTGCSEDSGNGKVSSSDEAIEGYSACMSDLRKKDNVSVEELAVLVNQWQVLDDSVRTLLENDTLIRPHSYPMQTYSQIKDSIKSEFIRMAASRPRNYRDLLLLKEQTSVYAKNAEIDAAAETARPFFLSLDSIPINEKGGKNGVVKRYLLFLDNSLKKDINSKEDLLDFISNEYSHYRAFTQYLPELANDNMEDITRKTKQCFAQILSAADQKAISYQDAMIYLTLRTNQRLLHNVQVALSDLKSGRVKSESIVRAYLWLLVQPFHAMDELSFAVLSDADKRFLYQAAGLITTEMNRLAETAGLDKGNLPEIPLLLMKMYFTRL